jgi:integrase
MRGHLTERRPGVWRIVVSAGFGPDGKRRQIVRTVHGPKRDAQRVLTQMLRDRDQGTLGDGRQPLATFLSEEWLPAVSAVSKRGRPLAPTTRQRYRDAAAHVSRLIGKVRLSELRPAHVETLRDRLLEGMAPQTVSDIMRVLSQALSRAEARGLVGRNVADPALVHRPAGEPRDIPVITPKLGQEILGAVTGQEPWDVAVHLALGVGLRREEVLALRWSDVTETVTVSRTITAAGGELHIGPPKSAAGERELPLPGFVARALQRHRKVQGERFLKIGLPRPELVLDRGDGEPWFPASFSTAWRRFANRHGWEGITFHVLRHGTASLLLTAGVPDAVALSVMGHADTRILRHYQGVAEELKREAASRMDSILGSQGSPG